mgnify:CR=1 FL=1
MNQRVSVTYFQFLGRTGEIVSCYDDGTLGVRLDGREVIDAFDEDQLYFPNHPLGYNQGCLN